MMRTIHNRKYQGVLIGMAIRGRIGTDKIFRVRPGNGYFDATLGDVFQDQYNYFVPTSITSAGGQAARDALTAGVTAWQALTPEQKATWNYKATRRGLSMSGYNLYIKEYIEATI